MVFFDVFQGERERLEGPLLDLVGKAFVILAVRERWGRTMVKSALRFSKYSTAVLLEFL